MHAQLHREYCVIELDLFVPYIAIAEHMHEQCGTIQLHIQEPIWAPAAYDIVTSKRHRATIQSSICELIGRRIPQLSMCTALARHTFILSCALNIPSYVVRLI